VLILAIIVLGLFAGWVAQLILGRRQIDWTLALVAGLLGSLIGGMLFSVLFGDGLDLTISGPIGSIIGAIIVIAVVSWVQGTRHRSRA
jgi:uncharacterized membrane protein YeaQ/YmgE (transglycosylase-associated protein family)